MSEKIKKFFKKKKIDTKFKLAGPGYRLDATSQCSSNQQKEPSFKPVPRAGLTDESKQAAAAALARLGGQKNDAAFNTSLAAIQAQVKRELEAEKHAKSRHESKVDSVSHKFDAVELESSPLLAVQGVYFRCPLISDEVLPREEWNSKIKTFLYDQLEEERGLTSVLIIHTLNKNKEKVTACVETLCRYLENIIQNPTEEKFKKIRMSNRIYQEKVAPMEGVSEFMRAAGFVVEELEFQGNREDFLVFNESKLVDGCDTLEILIDALRNAEPIQLELDRSMQVLLPSQAAKRHELPASFFNLTPEELKKEQQARSESAERSLMLRTKTMREKDELREMRKYRFALIRIKFPDGVMLQGTFGVYEKFSNVLEFLHEHIAEHMGSFILSTPVQQLSDGDADKSLLELKLVPASILNFTLKDHSKKPEMYLRPEVMILITDV